ncbi:MAG: hypothetical protein JWQ49_4610 [Edaphobacter sp.]|nr:hypothetical protein [Edaphobacter sp.]
MLGGVSPNGHKLLYSRLRFQMSRCKLSPWLTGLRRMRNGNLIGSSGDNTFDGAHDGVDVFVVGLPVADADAHGASALECSAGEEGSAFGADGSDDLVRKYVMIGSGGDGRWVQEADEALVDNGRVECLGVWQRTDTRCELGSEAAAAIDEQRNTVAAQFAECGVSGEAAGAARHFGIEVDRIARVGACDDVGGAFRHGCLMRFGMCDEGVGGVVGDIEPLVAVDGPGVSEVRAVEQVRVDGEAAAQRPNAPSMWTQALWRCAIGMSAAKSS